MNKQPKQFDRSKQTCVSKKATPTATKQNKPRQNKTKKNTNIYNNHQRKRVHTPNRILLSARVLLCVEIYILMEIKPLKYKMKWFQYHRIFVRLLQIQIIKKRKCIILCVSSFLVWFCFNFEYYYYYWYRIFAIVLFVIEIIIIIFVVVVCSNLSLV